MNKGTKIGFIVGVLLLMTLFVWLFTGGENESNKTKDRSTFVSSNWVNKFQPMDKNPFGLFLFNTLLNSHVQSNNKIVTIYDGEQFDTTIVLSKEKNIYLFIGNNFGLEDKEIDTLLSHVERGSDLFISFNDLTENLYERLLSNISFEFDYAKHVNVYADTNRFTMYNIFQNDTVATDWRSFNHSPHSNIRTLSYFMGMSNFISIPHGNGRIMLQANPIMYVNYQVKRTEGFGYTNYTLETLARNRDVYLLELGRLSDNYGNFDVDEDGLGEKEDDSYFQLIFRTPQFLIALLLSIAGLILFVMFRSKRTRPVVDYIAPKKDMTMAFTETITSIYFSKRNPYGLLHVQRKNFYATVLKHFFVDLNRKDDKAIQSLAEKSNYDVVELENLIGQLETKAASSVSEEYVAKIQQKIHGFYRHAGIISDDAIQRIERRELKLHRSLWIPVILILMGLMCVVVGTYYLTAAVGVGIALWPIGIILLLSGIIRTMNPYMVITHDTFTFYRLPFGKKELNREKLVAVQLLDKGVIFKFIDNQEVKVDYREMGAHDRKQFKQFVAKINTLKL